ncbi:M56 family metallopeptidase [Blautia faecicola]|uniref:M56 family metallopeptidase n=1 Tax=Blautia faecicola TaxID=2509240 RepID=A0A4Q1RIJ1_9FIRM|nr:M56 family metallopeptidase [Blautia faecicola]RXS75527.1 M56 family metallopeptidase [Blautia faecicola]
MLDFSISSVNMAILVSNLFIIFLVLIFRNRKILFRLGLPLLVGFVILICVRMIFPVELLPISHNVYLPDLLTTIVGETRRTRFLHDTVSWWNILELVWICGILYSSLKYFNRNHAFRKYVKKHASALSESSIQMRVFTQIKLETTKKGIQKMQLLALPLLKSPIIYGLWKPFILIPNTLELSETEWRYVLLHEVNHYRHKDLYIKFLLHIICIIYWWNPFCRFLKNDTDTILEMRIDQTLADTPAHKVEYLSCLLKTASYQIENPVSIPDFSINFCDSVLVQRFDSITKNNKRQDSYTFKITFLFFAIFLYLGSYFITFESNYFPADLFTDDIIIPTEDNCFVIECPDGQYDFYLYGKYIETLPDKEHCIIGITTYKNIQEARKHEKIISEK